MPSHLISNAQPASSTGSVPVTAFIGRSCSSFTDYNTRMADSLAGQAGLVTGGGSGIGLACARHLVRDGASVTLMGRSEDRLRRGRGRARERRRRGSEGALVRRRRIVRGRHRSRSRVGSDGDGRAAARGRVGGHRNHGTGRRDARCPSGSACSTSTSRARSSRSSTPRPCSHAPAEGRSSPSRRSPVRSRIRTWRRTRCRRRASRRSCATRPTSSGRAGVRVNAVRPGLVPTELADPLVADEQVQADYLAQMPLHRLGTVDDIAAGVRYLLGPESSWVTGQILGDRRRPHAAPWTRHRALGEGGVRRRGRGRHRRSRLRLVSRSASRPRSAR